jgi:hypothetical protein
LGGLLHKPKSTQLTATTKMRTKVMEFVAGILGDGNEGHMQKPSRRGARQRRHRRTTMSRHRDPILEHQRQKREQAVELGIRGWGCNMKQPHTETAEGEKSMSRNEVKGTHDLHYRLSWRLWPTEEEEGSFWKR